MRQKIQLLKTKLTENELILQVEDDINVSDIKATGQMLVDSDHLSFVYLIEKDEQYIYIVLDDKNWNPLKENLQRHLPVFLMNETGKLELIHFNEELTYLIENIKGNLNYGEKMVSKVEETFIME